MLLPLTEDEIMVLDSVRRLAERWAEGAHARDEAADGAAALGLNDCGSIEEGKLADLVLLDLQKPHVLPGTGDPASRVVYSARPSDVRSVWVDGKALVEEGELLPLRLPGIIREAEKAASRVRDRARN